MKKIFTIAIVCFTLSGYAQSTSNVQAKNEANYIKVKWLHPELYFNGGMDIYRSADNGVNWSKLNDKPLLMDTAPKPGDSKKMKTFLELIKQPSENNEEFGLARLAIISEIVSNKEYAERLNLYYEDSNVVSGTAYTYKIQQSRGNQIIGVSNTLIAGGDNAPFAIQNPTFLYANEEGARFKWDHDPKQYFGVNAFRKSNKSGEEVKLNKKPILVFKFYDRDGILRYPDVMMVDSTLRKGLEYTYTFRPVDFFNDEGESTEGIVVVQEDTEPPKPPKDLKVNVDKLNVKLSWLASKSDDVEGYRIIRQDVNLEETIVEKLVDGLSYEYNAESSGQFFFLVQAVDFAGNTSSTIIADGLIPDVFPTSAVTGFKAIFDENTGKVDLSWNPVPEQDDLVAYRLLRYASSEGKNPKDIQAYSNINNNIDKNTSYTDDVVLQSQTKYKYAIFTTDSVANYSEAQYSDWITIPDIVAPASPAIIDARADFDKITLTWLPSNDFDVVAYEVYRRKKEDGNASKLLEEISNENTSYEDSNVENAVSYIYAIKAKDASNNVSEASNEYVVKTRKKGSPTTSIDLKLKAKYKKKEKKTVLKWSTKDLKDIKGFVVFKQSEQGRFVPLSGLTSELSIEDTNAIKGNTYNYQVRVYTNSGQTLKSEIKSITI